MITSQYQSSNWDSGRPPVKTASHCTSVSVTHVWLLSLHGSVTLATAGATATADGDGDGDGDGTDAGCVAPEIGEGDETVLSPSGLGDTSAGDGETTVVAS